MPRRILIVEDDSVLRKHLARLLAGQGHQVTTAATCAEALEVLAKTPVENLLLDAKLPDGDGLSLLTQLGDDRDMPRTILMTAFCTPETEQLAKRLKVGCILRKPLDLAHVVTVFLND